MTWRRRRGAVRSALLIPACWLLTSTSASAQSPETRRERFIELLLARRDAQAIELLERQVRRAEVRVERLSQLTPSNPRQAAVIGRSLERAQTRLEILKDPALAPPLPSRVWLNAQLRRINAEIARMNARLELLVQRGTRRMTPLEARLYQRRLASLQAQIEQAEAQRDFLEREAASPTVPVVVALSMPGL